MNTTLIKESDIRELCVSSLPSRPTAPTSLGGRGYTATEMKSAFDKLPLFLVERFNMLISDISREGGISGEIPTGIIEGHTLARLFLDISSGEFASYLVVLGNTLTETIQQMHEDVANMQLRDGEEATKIAEALEWLYEADAKIDEVRALGESISKSFEALYPSVVAHEDAIATLSEEGAGQSARIEEITNRVDAVEKSTRSNSEAIAELLSGSGNIDCGSPSDLNEKGGSAE